MRRNSILASAILTLFVVGCGGGPSATQKVQTAQKKIRKLDLAVKEYSSKHKTYPAGLTVLVTEGLVEEGDLSDPWDQEYKYDPDGKKHRGQKPDIWTATPDNTRTLSN